jgi:uncharacterized protein (DUF1501 family)
MTSCPNVNAKKIVLIQLSGANDGLNTVVPINQYDKYAALRPNIKLGNAGTANGIINLDSTLTLANQVGLHPSLTGFKSLYDSGLMRIVQGVGYPSQDKSHFKSTDLWLMGGDGTPANNFSDSGWIGRFLENYYSNFLNANFPLGIQLGSSENSLGFHGEVEHGMSMNINGQDLSGFYSIINGLGGAAPTNIPDSEYGNLLKFILDNDTSSNTYAQTISAAFNSGSNASTYPNTSLANQLKTVARFISGGLETKVYLVKINGFDTHDLQVPDNTSTHLGTHANLMTQISEAITTFITDLNSQNKGDDVLAVTFSEFGRKAAENGNLGTDHGEIAPMFIFGSSIAPGISGTNVNLSEAVLANNYQIQTVQHDYRRVFGTILQDWFGVNTTTLDLTFYNKTTKSGFANAKIANMIKTQNVVQPSCYNTKALGIDNFEIKDEVLVYPNPTSEIVMIQSINTINSVSIYAMDGRNINTYRNPLTTNDYSIDVQNFAVGIYTLKVNTDKGSFSKKIIIRR